MAPVRTRPKRRGGGGLLEGTAGQETKGLGAMDVYDTVTGVGWVN